MSLEEMTFFREEGLYLAFVAVGRSRIFDLVSTGNNQERHYPTRVCGANFSAEEVVRFCQVFPIKFLYFIHKADVVHLIMPSIRNVLMDSCACTDNWNAGKKALIRSHRLTCILLRPRRINCCMLLLC